MIAHTFSPEHHHYTTTRKELVQKQNAMSGTFTWWEDFDDSNAEMEYVCDAKLGAPTEIDCTKLQRQSLRPPSDTVMMGPGYPKIVTSSKCPEQLQFPRHC